MKGLSPMSGKRFGRLVFIPGINEGRYPFCNSLFIDDGKKVIIDPGSDEAVLTNLDREGGLDIIVSSHYHEDHFTYNYLFPEAELYVHKDEVACYQSIESFLDYAGLKGTVFEHHWRDVAITTFHYRERTPSLLFDDGDILNFGKTKMEVIHTPGHTVGHCSFYFPDEGVLFLGDLDLSQFGPWYGDRVSDIDKTIESVHKLMKVPADIYISSHEVGIIEGPISNLAEQYLSVINTREKDLLHSLDKPQTLDEIIHQWIIYKKPREPRWMYEFMEGATIQKHLDRLIKKGIVGFTGVNYHLL
jgi:hydroxyacylglutathione hydrolase